MSAFTPPHHDDFGNLRNTVHPTMISEFESIHPTPRYSEENILNENKHTLNLQNTIIFFSGSVLAFITLYARQPHTNNAKQSY